MDSEDTFYFNEIDDCIIAAYKYVKKTGIKMNTFGTVFVQGFKSEDRKYFLVMTGARSTSGKNKLYYQIKSSGVRVLDVVNKQLLTFI